jgi:hypothetical protein
MRERPRVPQQASHATGIPAAETLRARAQDHGCHGGLMDFAFSFIIRNGGLDTEADYKYKAVDGVCNIAKEKRHVVTIDSYEDVPPMDESSLKKARALKQSPRLLA